VLLSAFVTPWLNKKSLLMNEFGNEEMKISQYSSQTNGALAEWKKMRRSELPEIVVRFHGAPHLIN